MMDFNLTEQQKMLKNAARDFFAKECPPSLVRDIVDGHTDLPREVWSHMAELGWMGLAIPEQYGGFEGSFLDLVVLLEEMGRAALPGQFFSTVLLGTRALLEAASEDQKSELLPAIAEGELRVTMAVLEPEAQHDAASIKTIARRTPNGYAIDGVKLFVPDAASANYIICVARADQGLSLFLVDSQSPGLTVTAIPTLTGERQCEVRFEGVEVPAKSLLGEAGVGWAYWQRVQACAVIGRCAELVGGAQRALELTLDYAKVRTQFGKPIGAFQHVQRLCCEMATDVESARYMTYHAAWLLSEGIPCASEVAATKAWVGEACRRSSFSAVEVHGAIGYCWEHDLPLYVRQAKQYEVSFGDADHHLEVVAAGLGL